MRRAGLQGAVGVALAAALLCACRTPPRAAVPPPLPPQPRPAAYTVAAQPGRVTAKVNGIDVLALTLPEFQRIPRDQRLLALQLSRAAAAGQAAALARTSPRDLDVMHVLHGVLAKPVGVPSALLGRIRVFARLLWLNGGMHDAQTGHKLVPPFTAADLRTAALAAQAGGADFRQGSVSLELFLRALEPTLFDPNVEPLRLPTPDAKQPLLPAAAAALDAALAYAAPPQGAVLEPLASFLRTGDRDAFREAQRAWVEAAGAVDFFAGFFDPSMVPGGRGAVFGAFAGLREEANTAALQRLAEVAPRPVVAEALSVAVASGAMWPLRDFAIALPRDPAQGAAVKVAVFAGAADAVGRFRTDPALRLLADPAVTTQLGFCLPHLRFAFLALRKMGTVTPISAPGPTWRTRVAGAEVIGDPNDPVTVPIFQDAQAMTGDALALKAGLLDETCRGLWPQFVAASLLASYADVPEGDRVDAPDSRAHQLELWWFTSKGALVLRSDGPRHFLAVPDPARFHAVAGELLQLVRANPGEVARLAEQHATRLDTHLRDEVLQRLDAAGIPRRVDLLPPRLSPVMRDGKLDDARAASVDDIDAEILRDWDAL